MGRWGCYLLSSDHTSNKVISVNSFHISVWLKVKTQRSNWQQVGTPKGFSVPVDCLKVNNFTVLPVIYVLSVELFCQPFMCLLVAR